MRERDERLVKWGGGSSDDQRDLEWDESEHQAWDQFRVNEEKFGVKTSYDENLYTTPLDKTTQFYRDNKAKATKLAAEMMGKSTDNVHMAQERGQAIESDLDEEAMFSGVLSSSPSSSSYVPPHKRAPSPSPAPTSKPLVVITTDEASKDAGTAAVKPATKPARKPLSMGAGLKFNPNAMAFKPKFNLGSVAAGPPSPPASTVVPVAVPVPVPVPLPPIMTQSPVEALNSSVVGVLAAENPRAVPTSWQALYFQPVNYAAAPVFVPSQSRT